MVENQSEFRRFSKIPLEGSVRLWKNDGIHKEPSSDSYQYNIKLNSHNIVLAEPDNRDIIIACVDCKRGIEVERAPVRVKKYIYGYFFDHPCA